jgi:integrase/recombinase XerD
VSTLSAGDTPKKRGKKMKSEKQILSDFRRYLNLKSIRTCTDYIASVKEFFCFLHEKGVSYNKVNAGTADEYRAHLLTKEKPLCRGTINNKLNRVRIFYKFLFLRRLIHANPLKHTSSLHTGETIPKHILSVEEMGRLLSGFGVKKLTDFMLKTLVELLYGSSLRLSEAKALKAEDIDFEAGSIFVTNFKENGKRWKAPATEVSLRVLKDYMKKVRGSLVSEQEIEEGYLFPQSKGKTAIRCMLNAKLARECRRLGLKVITSHSFRHSSATHMLKSGAGIREVQALLGHERITTTERYTRVVKEDLKKAITACHPRERRMNNEE